MTRPELDAAILDDRGQFLSIAAIAARRGVSATAVRRVLVPRGLNRHPKRLENQARIIELRRAGATYREIMQETDASLYIVSKVCQAAGLTGQAPGLRGPERKERTCLGPLCRGQRKFMSQHIGNRMCDPCLAAAEHRQSVMVA